MKEESRDELENNIDGFEKTFTENSLWTLYIIIEYN